MKLLQKHYENSEVKDLKQRMSRYYVLLSNRNLFKSTFASVVIGEHKQNDFREEV